MTMMMTMTMMLLPGLELELGLELDGRWVGRILLGAPGVVAGAISRFGRKWSYLVDPASSHMLVSKIKPCMCKYKLFCTVKLRMAH